MNFPTKGHWRARSRLEDVESGLEALVEVVRQHEISVMAVPALGCGLGGLEWQTVKPLIEDKLGGIDGLTVRLYAPTD